MKKNNICPLKKSKSKDITNEALRLKNKKCLLWNVYTTLHSNIDKLKYANSKNKLYGKTPKT